MHDVQAFILAGGKSSRMGTEKGLVLLNGKTFVEHILQALKPLQLPVSIISNNQSYHHLGLPVFKDVIPDKGPLGGIYTGLTFATRPYCLFLSCDIPFVQPDLLKFLISKKDHHSEAWIPQNKGQAEPLCGLYSTGCKNKIHDLLLSEKLSVRYALQQLNTTYLEISDESFYTDKILLNLNSKKETEMAENLSEETLSIHFFGVLAEISGASSIQLNKVHSLGTLKKELTSRYPEFKNREYIIAVNNRIEHSDILLSTNDKIDCMPPFSGG